MKVKRDDLIRRCYLFKKYIEECSVTPPPQAVHCSALYFGMGAGWYFSWDSSTPPEILRSQLNRLLGLNFEFED